MIQFALLIIVLTLGQDIIQLRLSKKIGAYWMKTIKDINNEKDNMRKIIDSVQKANETMIFHKIQMSMILQCESLIDIKIENYLSLSYKDVVQDFEYQQYIGMDFTLTKKEETLLRIIKKMEKRIQEIQINKINQNNHTNKHIVGIKVLINYFNQSNNNNLNIFVVHLNQLQQIEKDWQDAYNTNNSESTLLKKPNYFHYAFFLVLFVAIFGGGFCSEKMIQGMKEGGQNKNKNKAK